jgi:integrase
VQPSGPPAPLLSRERAKAPYSRAEIAAYLALCDAQPTEARRRRAAALICLGAGAGLVGADLKGVRGRDVVARAGGVVVSVTSGRRPRVVPVLSRYHDRLLDAARWAGERLLTGGTSATRRNVTTPLTAALAGGTDLPRIELGRLRATWLCEVAGSIGLRAFMDAAGITCSQRLGDLVAALDAVGIDEAVALLGGR